MNLTPGELDRLTIFTAAELARRYRLRGIRLSHQEAVALICDEVLTAARKGVAHGDMVDYGRSRLTADDIEPGVAHMTPFFGVNRALKFDRAATFGMRLDRPSRTGVRFEPGEIIHVDLVRIGGTGNVHGFARPTEGSINSGEVRQRGLRLAKERGYQGA